MRRAAQGVSKINIYLVIEGATYSLGVFDESFSGTHLPLILRNTSIRKDSFAAGLRIARPRIFSRIRCVRRKQVEPLDHLLERIPVRETGATNTDVLL